MAWEDLNAKARWADEAIGPINDANRQNGRALADLPNDVSPGARQVAQVTAFRAVQAAALTPVMQALQELQALPAEQWARGGYLVADSIRFDWKTAPFKHYASFEDFYDRELAETWGRWSDLQETWRAYFTKQIDAAEAERRIAKSASERVAIAREQTTPGSGQEVKRGGANNPEGRNQHSEPKEVKTDNISIDQPRSHKHGTEPAYLLRRLAKHAPDILAGYERGEFRSARAAAIAAGIIKPPTPFEEAQRAIRKLSSEQRRQLRDWIDSLDRKEAA